MKYRVAPEVRGTSLLETVAALGCAPAVFLAAGPPFRSAANAAEFQRWTDGRQPSRCRTPMGADVALETARGHVVLVQFFATWCAPRREELLTLNRLAAQANGSVRILAVSVAEVDLRVRHFIQTMPISFPIMLDRDRAVAKTWKVSTLPTTFLLDADLRPRIVVETNYAWDRVDPANLADMLAINGREQAAATTNITANPRQGGG